MINYIPRIYDDELFYSFIARYSEVSGNTSLRDIIKDIFGFDTLTPYMHFPCNISRFTTNVPEEVGLTNDYIISRHTMFPIYSPFLPARRKNGVLKEMKYSNGQRIGYLLGIQAGKVVNSKQLRYCPICVTDDMKLNGESYFHRAHQVDGILVCYKHGCKLKPYTFDKDKFISRLKFVALKENYIDNKAEYFDDSKSNIFLKMAKTSFFLLDKGQLNCNLNCIYKKYKMLLKKKCLLTISGEIKQDKVVTLFKQYYSNEVLDMINCNFDINDESSWVRNISRNYNSIINPIKHIMFIIFLNESIEIFFNNLNKRYDYFGKGPWPCLNPASDHYRKKIIHDVKITSDFKTRVPVGTFSCSCGFTYSRKGPDNLNEHLYDIGRIKSFGHVWEGELRAVTSEGNKSLREIARIMKCDVNTVKKYVSKITQGSVEVSGEIELNSCKNDYHSEKLLQHRNVLIKAIKENPSFSRTAIRRTSQKEYIWLYRNDKKWLYSHLPMKVSVAIKRNKVDWEKRDDNIQLKLKKAYNDILNNHVPIRVTKSRLDSVAGVGSILYTKIKKLPKTEKYIFSVIETIEDFQIRKVSYLYNSLLEKNGYVLKWQVVKLIGRKPSNLVKLYIDRYFNEFHIN